MSKRCPECHHINDDSRIFCAYCGSTLDAQLRLIQDLEKQQEVPSEAPVEKPKGDISFHSSYNEPEEKKRSIVPWVILGLVVIAAAAWFFLKG